MHALMQLDGATMFVPPDKVAAFEAAGWKIIQPASVVMPLVAEPPAVEIEAPPVQEERPKDRKPKKG